MTNKLTPLSEFPLAAGLPDFVEPEAFGVNEGLLNTIATVGCLNEVTLDWHRGNASQVSGVAFGGFAAPGAAFAVGSGSVQKSPLGKYDFTTPPSTSQPDMICGHTPHDVRVSVDVPEIQDRLSQIGKIRSLPHWTKMLDKAVCGQIRAASSEHLLKSLTTTWEGAGGAMSFIPVFIAESSVTDIKGAPWSTVAEVLLDTAIMTVGVHNAAKFALEATRALKGEGDGFENVCFSLIPGWHIDRRFGVEALTRARHIIRPMPTAK